MCRYSRVCLKRLNVGSRKQRRTISHFLTPNISAKCKRGHPNGGAKCRSVGWLEFNVPFQHKYGYIRDETKCRRGSLKLATFDK